MRVEGFCHPMAYEQFGEMPSQKGKLNNEELQSVAEWVYDRFEGEKFE